MSTALPQFNRPDPNRFGAQQPSAAPQAVAPVADSSQDLTHVLLNDAQLVISQKRSWWQLLTDLEARNKYKVSNGAGRQVGWIVEKSSGFLALLKRLILKSHRPFFCTVLDNNTQPLLYFTRKFFWFFSDITVMTPQGVVLGSAHRRFSFFKKRYDLCGPDKQVFARINSGFFSIWTFKIFDTAEHEAGKITKKWGGALKELFTDEDNFMVEFGPKQWRAHERSVIFAVAISIDFDYFERNGKKGGLLNIFGD